MNKKSVLEFCKYIYKMFDVPIRCYDNQLILKNFSSNNLNSLFLDLYENELLSKSQNLSYIISKNYFYYGIVKIKNSTLSIAIGPISSTKPNKNTLDSILNTINIPNITYTDLECFFNNLTLISFEKFLQILCFINFICNKENLTTDDIFDYKNKKYETEIYKSHTQLSYESKENEDFHNTHYFEELYLSYIEKCDLDGLNNLLETSSNLTPGMMAHDNIRQIKNLFIASATLITRAAIRGGLDIETSYQLSDTYIQQMEHLENIEFIHRLQYEMMCDFTNRIKDAKMPLGVSNIIYKCIQYISRKTNESITVSDVADHVHRSRSFISRTFKAETGIDLSAYIMNKKLDEAKNLLKFTDKTISEISNYLCFSSQSYFQNVFKKNFNLTPNEYRKKYAK